jgi:hypothetical protein
MLGMSAIATLKRLGTQWNTGRPALIMQARAEGETWQDIADALHMTPNGVRKLAGYRRDVYLYRGDINSLGEIVARADLPDDAVKLDIEHYEDQGEGLRPFEVYLLRD